MVTLWEPEKTRCRSLLSACCVAVVCGPVGAIPSSGLMRREKDAKALLVTASGELEPPKNTTGIPLLPMVNEEIKANVKKEIQAMKVTLRDGEWKEIKAGETIKSEKIKVGAGPRKSVKVSCPSSWKGDVTLFQWTIKTGSKIDKTEHFLCNKGNKNCCGLALKNARKCEKKMCPEPTKTGR
eukprot:gnl/TRDRNA2_/TRDRNA2_183165_c0_seq1.p1 gnl/TRDRNA2_/TRDRNA2_183165_c0~~gnl/TRDRNA2_/TRDRNA2_183165_c0_seq1.p1  ORF type:complete len:182 (+),score=22.74 gnl/TRDRNA2_/TRDRNA2_183165_c0_seq1:55-600(+)